MSAVSVSSGIGEPLTPTANCRGEYQPNDCTRNGIERSSPTTETPTSAGVLRL